MSSGNYFPQSVMDVEIPKKSEGFGLDIPTILGSMNEQIPKSIQTFL